MMVKGFYDIDTTITIDEKKYYARLATIDRTELGYEDHGIFTAQFGCNMGGSYVTAGGFALDSPRRDDDNTFVGRFPTEFGMAFIIKSMEVFQVDHWEKIKGQQAYVLMDERYGPPRGFASTFDTTRFFIFEDLRKEYYPDDIES